MNLIYSILLIFAISLIVNEAAILRKKDAFKYLKSHWKSVEDCGSSGLVNDLRLESCPSSEDVCLLIPKRNYNFEVDFMASIESTNPLLKISALLEDNSIIIIRELEVSGTIYPGNFYTLIDTLNLPNTLEGVNTAITFELIDQPTETVEICVSRTKIESSSWNMIPEILSRIKEPEFPDRDFNILTFGAIGDNQTLNTEAIRSAIEACNEAGGGRVIVPEGLFLTGPITLLSNVNLHLEAGSEIIFTQDTTQYPNVFCRWEGMELMNFSPFVYAYEAENIAITGSGILNGNSDCDHWWPWKGRNSNLDKLCGVMDRFPNETIDRNNLMSMVENYTPVEERIFGQGHYLRPYFVQPYKSKNILIEGVTFFKSPMWIINPVLCENVIVREIHIDSRGPNSDGVDPESCKDVLIENVHFSTGDDCVAVKSGRNNDGRRLNVSSEYIIVQNCRMEMGHGGFTIGSEISGGARYIFSQNNVMESPDLEQALRFKNNAVRGGLIEDIFMRNIQIRELYTGPSPSRGMALSIDYNYEEGSNGDYTPIVRNIDIRNVTSGKSQYALFLKGFPENLISDISLKDCHFDNVDRPNVLENVGRISLVNVTVNGEPVRK